MPLAIPVRMEIDPVLAVPVLGLVVAGVMLLYQSARQRGFKEGVTSAQVDPTTRLVSPAMAEHMLAVEFAAAERGRPLTVVLFSIDNFRRLAAMEGGAARERLLLTLGAVLRRRTRGMHVSARMTDDGVFMSVLGGVEMQGAATFVARVRRDLSTIGVGAQPLVISVSVCPYRADMHSVSELMGQAYGTLAEARAKGGNAVAVSGEL